jgi:hypothetical protein
MHTDTLTLGIVNACHHGRVVGALAILLAIGQMRMAAENGRKIIQYDPALAEVHIDGISRGDGVGLTPYTAQCSPLPLVRLNWATRERRQGREAEAAVQAALPTAMMAQPRTYIRVDGQAGVATLMP